MSNEITHQACRTPKQAHWNDNFYSRDCHRMRLALSLHPQAYRSLWLIQQTLEDHRAKIPVPEQRTRIPYRTWQPKHNLLQVRNDVILIDSIRPNDILTRLPLLKFKSTVNAMFNCRRVQIRNMYWGHIAAVPFKNQNRKCKR